MKQTIQDKAEHVRNESSIGTGIEVGRLLKGLQDGIITESDANKALDYMLANGGTGHIAFAEKSLLATGFVYSKAV